MFQDPLKEIPHVEYAVQQFAVNNGLVGASADNREVVGNVEIAGSRVVLVGGGESEGVGTGRNTDRLSIHCWEHETDLHHRSKRRNTCAAHRG